MCIFATEDGVIANKDVFMVALYPLCKEHILCMSWCDQISSNSQPGLGFHSQVRRFYFLKGRLFSDVAA